MMSLSNAKKNWGYSNMSTFKGHIFDADGSYLDIANDGVITLLTPMELLIGDTFKYNQNKEMYVVKRGVGSEFNPMMGRLQHLFICEIYTKEEQQYFKYNRALDLIINHGKKVSCTRWGTEGKVYIFEHEATFINKQGNQYAYRVLLLHDTKRDTYVTFTPSVENQVDDAWYVVNEDA